MKVYKVKLKRARSAVSYLPKRKSNVYEPQVLNRNQTIPLDKVRSRIFQIARNVWQSLYPGVELMEGNCNDRNK